MTELTNASREWLRNSLRHRLDDARKAERNARGAYTKGSLAAACELLADAHAEVVAVYVRALNGLTRPEDLPGYKPETAEPAPDAAKGEGGSDASGQ